jgi:hypothetical protein
MDKTVRLTIASIVEYIMFPELTLKNGLFRQGADLTQHYTDFVVS